MLALWRTDNQGDTLPFTQCMQGEASVSKVGRIKQVVPMQAVWGFSSIINICINRQAKWTVRKSNLLPLHFILTYGVKNSEHNPVNYHLLLPILSDGFMFAAICKAGNKMKTFELFQAAVDYWSSSDIVSCLYISVFRAFMVGISPPHTFFLNPD